MIVFLGILGLSLIVLAGWLSPLNKYGQTAKAVAELRGLQNIKATGEFDDAEIAARERAIVEQLTQADGRKSWKDWRLSVAVAAVGLGLLAYTLAPHQSGETKPALLAPAGAPWASSTSGTPGTDSAVPTSQNGGDLNTLVKRLADKMERDPNNLDGWVLLAKTYVELRQHAEAARAFESAAKLGALDSMSYADWADVHVMANGRQWDDKARDLVKRALKSDGKNTKALSLAGSEAFDRKRYKEAIEYWQRQEALEPDDSIGKRLARSNIEEAKAVQSGKLSAKDIPAPDVSSSVSLSGSVTLDQAFRNKVDGRETVFIIVKAPDGSSPPIAVKKALVTELPYRFQFSDADAMLPGRSISSFSELLVSARISKSGDPAAQPGDLMSNVVRVRPGVSNIQIVFDGK